MAGVEKMSGGSGDRHWFILGRWQEYEGEARASVLRIAAIGAFYLVELVNYYGLRLGFVELPPVVGASFHQTVTALAVVWTMAAFAVLLCLRQRFFPSLLKYLSTGCDLLMLTVILAVADGPRSPLVVGYILLVVLSALRFSLPLVRFTTLGAMAGYLMLLGYARWFTDRDLHVPRYCQLIFLLALAIAGVLLGQVLRRVQGLAREYAQRLESGKGESP